MYAIAQSNDNTLIWQAHSASALQLGQVRLRIVATAVNRADLMQRKGLYPAPHGYSNIIGLECAGEVIEVGSDDKLERCQALGATKGINRRTQSLMDLKPYAPFDVVLDPVAGPSLNNTVKLMNVDARLLLIGLMGGTRAELDIGRILVKRIKNNTPRCLK